VTYPYAESFNAGSDHSMVIAEMQLWKDVLLTDGELG
jgi:hypothetical protein